MRVVKVSPKVQAVIPLEVRQRLGLKAGESVQVMEYDGRIELIPRRSLRNMRGFRRGIDTTIARDDDRR